MLPLIQGLLRPEAYDHPVSTIQLLETHISWVVLTGEYAYKLKKPVNLGFVDFTTLERRRYFCEEEIRLNRRLAPDLYLGVRSIFGSVEHPAFHESGSPFEFAVQMRQFDQRSLLPAVLNRNELLPEYIDRLALTIADFHAEAAIAQGDSPYGTPAAVRAPAMANFECLETDTVAKEQIAALKVWTKTEFDRLRGWFQSRRDTGRVRECHGDLHLGNMVLLDDAIQPFDCLEFNPDLRWIDIISEVAFLVMDLEERDRPDLAYRALNQWLQQSGDYEGLKGWSWYVTYRALVRAKVAALRMQQPDVDAAELGVKRQELATYLDLASGTIQTRKPALIVLHGFSGSGKSFVAQWVCERFGAIRLRSDAERKRVFGRWGTSGSQHLTGDMYAPNVTQSVYREILAGVTPALLTAGFTVVIDSACLQRWQRTVFRDLATRLDVPCLILDVQASPDTMRRRLASRQSVGGDPSDADVSVLNRQLAEAEPLTSEEQTFALAVDSESAQWQEMLTDKLRHRVSIGSG